MSNPESRWSRLGEGARSRAALARLQAAARAGASLADWSGTGDAAAYAKGGPIPGRAQVRLTLRARVGMGLPRLREFDNLVWLRRAHFLAPEPLAALATWRSERPSWQGLVTAGLFEAEDVVRVLAETAPDGHGELCRRLGATVARLHAAGFVHRDLFLRNLLFTSVGADTAVGLLDCWRGGPKRADSLAANILRRGTAYDLGCLFVHLPGLVARADEGVLLEEYAKARNLSPRRAAALFARAARARRALALRELARARKDASPIAPDWAPPF